VVQITNELVESLRDSGAIENLLRGIYYAAAASARYDAISHVLPAFGIVNSCLQYAKTFDPTCDGHFAQGRTTAAAKRRHRSSRTTDNGLRTTRAAPVGPRQTAPPRPPARTPAPEQLGGRLRNLLDNLLGPVTKPQPRRENDIPLLDYLLR
jgi:hypothetical protein